MKSINLESYSKFSTNLQNNTDVIFITCDGLKETKTAVINSKL